LNIFLQTLRSFGQKLQRAVVFHLCACSVQLDFWYFLKFYFKIPHDILKKKNLFFTLVDEIMIALLDAGERETVFTACGVLINLMTDGDVRPKLREEGGIKKYSIIL
jgi:hypothetical protein